MAVERSGAIERVTRKIWTWSMTLNRGAFVESPSPDWDRPRVSERMGEQWQGEGGPKGDTGKIRGCTVPLAVLTFAALVGQASQRKHPQQPAASRAWENRGGDKGRLGALSSKCKLSHLSAINQEVYGVMLFALQLKNHKAGTLLGCRKQNSRVSTEAAVNQLLLMSCCPAPRWGVYWAPNSKQDSWRKWDGHQRTAFPGRLQLGFSLWHRLYLGLGKIFLTNLIGNLGLFSSIPTWNRRPFTVM